MENKNVNQENVTYEILMEVKRIKGEKNGKKYDFLTYEGYDKTGKKCRFIFTRDCKEGVDYPDSEGEFIVYVDKKDINRDKSSKYARYYIKATKNYEVFSGSYDNDEDLPF